MGQEATEFVNDLMELCQENKVIIEFDIDRRDKYGRLLAYVFCEKQYGGLGVSVFSIKYKLGDRALNGLHYELIEGLFLNATIIKSGYATPMTIPPNVKYADLFKELYEEAREQKRGLWKQNQIESKIIDAKKVRLIGLDALLNHDSATGIRKFPKTVEDEYLKIIARKDVSWSVYYAPPHSAGAYEVWFVEIDNEGTVVGGNHKRE